MIGPTISATVYSAHATTGQFTVEERVLERAQLLDPFRSPPATGPERAEAANLRIFVWEPADYDLPETAQIDADGERWNVVPGTFKRRRGPTGSVVHRLCDVVRAK